MLYVEGMYDEQMWCAWCQERKELYRKLGWLDEQGRIINPYEVHDSRWV
jgi:hypothetical protein